MDHSRRRVAKIQEEMVALGVDVIVTTKPQSVMLLSGFNPVIQSHPAFVVVPAKGDPYLLVNALRINHAVNDSFLPAEQIKFYGFWSGRTGLAMDGLEALGQLVAGLGAAARRVGIEFDHVPFGVAERFKQIFPNAEFQNVAKLLLGARLVKSSDEIDLIRKAAQIADAGMEAALEQMRPGNTEIQVAVRSMQAMQEAWLTRFPQHEAVDFGTPEGGCLNSLWCYCLSGPRMNHFADSASNKRLEPGELTLAIIWTALGGYHAENERTVAMEPVPTNVAHAFEAILETREIAIKAMRPGNACRDVYVAATDVMKRHGYGDVLPGRVGHAIGLGAHEEPSLGPKEETLFVPGMVFSFEPSIRIGAAGGIQHSDTVLVTETGVEFLTSTPRGFLRAQ